MWSNRYTGPGALKMDIYTEAVVSYEVGEFWVFSYRVISIYLKNNFYVQLFFKTNMDNVFAHKAVLYIDL